MKHVHPSPRQTAALPLLVMALALAACHRNAADSAPLPSAAIVAAAKKPPAEMTIPDASAPISFAAELEFVDLVFKLNTHGDGARRLLTVTATRGAAQVGETGTALLDGGITSAFAADLDGDRQAEIAVITKSPDGRSGFTALAFDGRAYKEYRLPELEAAALSDAVGPDEFAFENGQIVRRFPIKTGGSRSLPYRFDPATGFHAEGRRPG